MAVDTGAQNRPLNELFDLSGKVALVIGGTGYLGTAMSEALAEAGASVAIAGRSMERCTAAAVALPPVSQQHVGVACDVADEASTRQGVDQVAAHFGRLDILVNSVVDPRRVDIESAGQLDFAMSLGDGSITARNRLTLLVGPEVCLPADRLRQRPRSLTSAPRLPQKALLGQLATEFEAINQRLVQKVSTDL